jgi:cyclase
MGKVRLIARLDIKGPNLIKGIHLEGLRVMGPPHEFAHRYYKEGIDEIIYMDTVASLYGRNSLTELVENIIPMIGRADDTLIKASIGLNKDDVELLYRLTEEKELILAYSRKLNKPVEDVQNSWNQIKEKLLQTKVEEYEYLYTELVEKLESKLNP